MMGGVRGFYFILTPVKIEVVSPVSHGGYGNLSEVETR